MVNFDGAGQAHLDRTLADHDARTERAEFDTRYRHEANVPTAAERVLWREEAATNAYWGTSMVRLLNDSDRDKAALARVLALADRWEADAKRACHGADHGGSCGDCNGSDYAAELRAALDPTPTQEEA